MGRLECFAAFGAGVILFTGWCEDRAQAYLLSSFPVWRLTVHACSDSIR